MDGFSFNGTHCSEFGIGYIPAPANRMLGVPEYSQIEETVTGRHGGYNHGNQVKIREFKLECYIEGASIETFERMYQWIHRDQAGKLIFDDRPFVYYNVYPSQKPTGKLYPSSDSCNSYNKDKLWSGTLTLYFKAFEPFGYMNYTSYEGYDIDGASMYCGIIESHEMPPKIEPSVGDYLVYNPGTEVADTVIRISGTAPEGVSIVNYTTGDKCVLLTLPPDPDYLELDSQSGSVQQLPSKSESFAFEYHDEGFIRLAPCTPYKKGIAITYKSDSNIVEMQGCTFDESWIGKYIRINGEWKRITYIQDDSHAVVNQLMNASGTDQTMAVVMNQISIEGTDVELTTFEIEYVPRVR